jgi:hypothetical protein
MGGMAASQKSVMRKWGKKQENSSLGYIWLAIDTAGDLVKTSSIGSSVYAI